MPLAVRNWGHRAYPESLEEMRRLRADRRRGLVPDTLLLVEHDPVITVGVQGAGGDPLPAGIPVVSVERGGMATYHGPGQFVAYPIVDLEPRNRDVRGFVSALEEATIRTLADVGVEAGRRAGHRGVWVREERKIASVGIAVEEWVTFHGVAVNLDPDLDMFARFHPCGFPGEVMTSVRRELGRSLEWSTFASAFVAHLAEVLDTAPTLRAASIPTAAPPA